MKFEVISKYKDAQLNLPTRKTKGSAGYDFQVAEDITVPSYFNLMRVLKQQDKNENEWNYSSNLLTLTSPEYKSLSEVAAITKQTYCKPTLVPTGIKCEMPQNMYLELSVRSSCPLKHWLILANGVGIIDADYYNNPDNEGHIYFQIINLSPFDILLKKGDTIGQGILKQYFITDNDTATAERQGGFGSTDNAINKLVDIGLPQVITSNEYKYIIDKIISCDIYNNGEKINTLVFPEEENTNKECRAYFDVYKTINEESKYINE